MARYAATAIAAEILEKGIRGFDRGATLVHCGDESAGVRKDGKTGDEDAIARPECPDGGQEQKRADSQTGFVPLGCGSGSCQEGGPALELPKVVRLAIRPL